MENIDPGELAKFALLANSWWDLEGDCKPLHDMNPCRGGFIASRSLLDGATVLDVGCGGGILSEYLADLGAVVTGIDASAELISVAQLHARSTNKSIRYVCTTIEEFEETSVNSYDVVTCMELLEHVPDPQRLVGECARRLGNSGNLFFSTINRTAKAYGSAILTAEYLLKILPRGTHDYAKFIKPSELARWGRSSGLETRELRGMSYNPFTRITALRDDLDVNFIAHLAPEQ